jgi:hypothetical protein
MGRTSKFTKEQILWLTARLPDFSKAQDNKTLVSFWGPFYTSWFKVYPFIEPDAAMCDDVAKAKADKLKAEKSVSSSDITALARTYVHLSAALLLVIQSHSRLDFRHWTQEGVESLRKAKTQVTTFSAVLATLLRKEVEKHT